MSPAPGQPGGAAPPAGARPTGANGGAGAARPAPWRPGEPLRIETRNYTMRSLAPADVNREFISWARDPEVMTTLNLPPRELSYEQMVGYVKRFDNKSKFGIGVFAKDAGGKLIGFYAVYCDIRNATAQTNVVIGDRAYWGKKVVIETRGALIDFLFDRMNMHKIWGMPLARNFPSVFNYKAQGFTCEGVMREHRRGFSGGRLDQYIFGLLKSEWKARRRTPGA
jgi:RimJ/RimL family protein N-acetyltransferase